MSETTVPPHLERLARFLRESADRTRLVMFQPRHGKTEAMQRFLLEHATRGERVEMVGVPSVTK